MLIITSALYYINQQYTWDGSQKRSLLTLHTLHDSSSGQFSTLYKSLSSWDTTVFLSTIVNLKMIHNVMVKLHPASVSEHQYYVCTCTYNQLHPALCT